MKDNLDDFEKELGELRPRAPTTVVRQRIADGLASPCRPGRWQRLASSIVIAASLLAMISFLVLRRSEVEKINFIAHVPPERRSVSPTITPTVQRYQKAWEEHSSTRLDSVLDRFSVHEQGNRSRECLRAVARYDSELEPSTGEL